MELRHLRYFLAAAETQSFTLAARRLRIAQPSMSIQIQKLEEELGVKLFLRGNRKVELTPAGRQFLEEASAGVARLDEAVEALQGAVAGRAGKLTIFIEDAAWTPRLCKRLRKFLRRNRGVRLEVQGRQCADKERDATISQTISPTVGGIELDRDDLCAWVSPKHRLAARPQLAPADLVGETLLLTEERSAAQQWLVEKVAGQATAFQVVPSDTAERLASLGLGIAVGSSDRKSPFGAESVPVMGGEQALCTELLVNPRSRAAAVEALLDFFREPPAAPATPTED